MKFVMMEAGMSQQSAECKLLDQRAHELARWFQSLKGQAFVKAEIQLVKQSLPKIFGSYCGISSVYPIDTLLTQVPCRRTCQFLPFEIADLMNDPASITASPSVMCRFADLPLEDNSLDGLVLLHTLDFVANPHDAVREMARVIRPGGQLLLVGFNPASLLGLGRFVPTLFKSGLWHARFLRRQRLMDWMALLQFEVELTEGIQLVPGQTPLKPKRAAESFAANNEHPSLGRELWTKITRAFRERHGSVYFLRARKTQFNATLVGYDWKTKSKSWNPLSSGVAVSQTSKPSTQGADTHRKSHKPKD